MRQMLKEAVVGLNGSLLLDWSPNGPQTEIESAERSEPDWGLQQELRDERRRKLLQHLSVRQRELCFTLMRICDEHRRGSEHMPASPYEAVATVMGIHRKTVVGHVEAARKRILQVTGESEWLDGAGINANTGTVTEAACNDE
jgi:hypothetical protein